MRIPIRPITTTIAAVLLLGVLAPGTAVAEDPADEFPIANAPGTAVADAVQFLRAGQAPDGGVGDFAVSAWVALAAVHAGDDPDEWRSCATCPSLEAYLIDQGAVEAPGFLSSDWGRQLLALAASGADVRDAGGVDYVAGLLSTFDGTQFGDRDVMGDDFFGLLALHATGETATDPAVANAVARTTEWIVENQFPDGGWSWRSLATTEPFFLAFGPTSDVDSTAIAIQALSAAGFDTDSLAVERGLNFIQTHQYIDGGCGGSLLFDVAFSQSLESNTASTSWAVGAIVATGGDPKSAEWTAVSGNDLVDYLLDTQNADGGFPWKPSTDPASDVWMTAYVVTALTGNSYVVG